MTKDLILDPIKASLAQICLPLFYFFIFFLNFIIIFGEGKGGGGYLYQLLYMVASYHCKQFQGKLKKQTLEKIKKPSFWPVFSQIWSPKSFFVGFTSTRYYTMLPAIILCNFKENKQNLKKWQKTQFGVRFWPLCPKFRPPKFFSFILPLIDVRKCCTVSLYAISRKTNKPNLRK